MYEAVDVIGSGENNRFELPSYLQGDSRVRYWQESKRDITLWIAQLSPDLDAEGVFQNLLFFSNRFSPYLCKSLAELENSLRKLGRSIGLQELDHEGIPIETLIKYLTEQARVASSMVGKTHTFPTSESARLGHDFFPSVEITRQRNEGVLEAVLVAPPLPAIARSELLNKKGVAVGPNSVSMLDIIGRRVPLWRVKFVLSRNGAEAHIVTTQRFADAGEEHTRAGMKKCYIEFLQDVRRRSGTNFTGLSVLQTLESLAKIALKDKYVTDLWHVAFRPGERYLFSVLTGDMVLNGLSTEFDRDPPFLATLLILQGMARVGITHFRGIRSNAHPHLMGASNPAIHANFNYDELFLRFMSFAPRDDNDQFPYTLEASDGSIVLENGQHILGSPLVAFLIRDSLANKP